MHMNDLEMEFYLRIGVEKRTYAKMALVCKEQSDHLSGVELGLELACSVIKAIVDEAVKKSKEGTIQ